MHENLASPKRYYGWTIAVTLAVTETISWGIIYYAFSVFLTPMENDLGWSRGELTGAYSLALLVAGAMAFPVGVWIDRHGARLLMTVGSLAAAVFVIAWSQVTDLAAFYLIWAGLGVCAAAVLYEPAFAVIATWFNRRRGRALAIVTFAAGLASTIFVPLSDALLHAFGWRSAILILGIFMGLATLPLHALVLRRRPDDLGLLADGRTAGAAESPVQITHTNLHDALHSPSFWLLTIAFGLSNLAAAAIRVHFIPFLIDGGIDASSAALASGAIGLMQVAGRVIFAPLEARLPGRVMVAGVFGLQAVAMSILLFGFSTGVVGLFIVLFGAAVGARTLARPAILATWYGSAHYGRISSVMATFLTFSGTVAPVGAGLLYDRSGSYQMTLWVVLALSILSVVVMAFVKVERAASVSLIASD